MSEAQAKLAADGESLEILFDGQDCGKWALSVLKANRRPLPLPKVRRIFAAVQRGYSITSTAIVSSDGGTVPPPPEALSGSESLRVTGWRMFPSPLAALRQRDLVVLQGLFQDRREGAR